MFRVELNREVFRPLSVVRLFTFNVCVSLLSSNSLGARFGEILTELEFDLRLSLLFLTFIFRVLYD